LLLLQPPDCAGSGFFLLMHKKKKDVEITPETVGIFVLMNN
jgi:hypothetical protein